MALNMRCNNVRARTNSRGAAQAAVPLRSRRVVQRVVAETDGAVAAAPAKVSTEKTGPNFKPLRDINQIMGTLPHRCARCATGCRIANPCSSVI
jgi:3-hydroxyacyl-[acyl-carrier-protein] dehydratase